MDATMTRGGLKPRMLVGLGTPLIMVMLLSMMVLPLPPLLLDLLFTFNIAFGIIVLMVSVYSVKPL